MIEKIAAPEDEVMLVPETLAHIAHARGLDRRLMDRIVIGLGPFADQLQRLPIVAAFFRVRGIQAFCLGVAGDNARR